MAMATRSHKWQWSNDPRPGGSGAITGATTMAFDMIRQNEDKSWRVVEGSKVLATHPAHNRAN
jgi:hypothetical protein